MKRIIPYIIILIFILIAYVFVYQQQDRESVAQLEAAFNEQQAIHVALAARSIEDRFRWQLREIEVLLQQYTLYLPGLPFEHAMARYAPLLNQTFENEYLLIAYAPIDGTLLYLEPTDDAYTAIFDDWLTEYGRQAAETESAVVTPVQATPEQQIYGIFAAVHNDRGEMTGVFGAILDLSIPLENYVAPMRSGDYGAGWVQDHRGVVIYDHESAIIGQNVAELHADHAEMMALDQRFLEEQVGTGEYSFTVEHGSEAYRKLVAWDTARLGNMALTVAMSAPDTEVGALLADSRYDLALLNTAFTLFIIFGGVATFYLSQRDLRVLVRSRTDELAKEREALRRSEARYRALFEQAIDAIFIENRETNLIIDANPAAERMFGYDLATLRTLKTYQLQPPEYANMPERSANRFETQGQRKDGTVFPLDISATIIEAGNGTEKFLLSTMRDITERKANEEALKRVERLFVRGPVIVFRGLAESAWPLEYVSPNVVHLGYTPEQLTSGEISYWDIIHPEDVDAVSQEASKHLREGDTYYEQDYRMINADGRVMWVYDFTLVIQDKDGNATHYDSYIVDITERKEAEIALKESEERFRALYEQSLDGVFIIGLDRRMVACNPSGAAMLGYDKADELVGRLNTEFLLPEDHENSKQRFKALANQRQLPIDERTFLRKDGSTFIGETNTALMLDSEGNPSHILSLVRDVTERKQNEMRLRESEERFRQVAENVQEIFFVYDYGKKGLLYVNPMFEHIWQHPQEKTLGNIKHFLRTIHKEDIAELVAFFRHLPEEARELEFRIKRPDDSVRWIRARIVPIMDETDQPTGQLVGIAEDVTERRQAVDRSLQAQIEQERIRLLSGFIRDVSHEFKTPLSIINTSLYLLQKRAALDEDNRHLRDIRMQSDNILRLVDALVMMSRLDSGTQFDFSPTSINALVQQINGSILENIAAKKLSIEFALQDNIPLTRAAPHELHRAYSHILENAVEFTPAEGHITVRTYIAYEQIIIEVQDTGVGMSAEELQAVFDRFYRRDKAHSTSGLGLGLSIARSIVEGHRGWVDAESTEGEGSIFRIYLPLSSETTSPRSLVAPAPQE